jgi:hypothetical protein
MAMDTMQKRMSAMNHSSPWRGPLVDATESSTTQGNRQSAAFMYAGILAAAAAAIVDYVSITAINATFASPTVTGVLFATANAINVTWVTPNVTNVEVV